MLQFAPDFASKKSIIGASPRSLQGFVLEVLEDKGMNTEIASFEDAAASLVFTEAAATKVRSLIEEEKNDNLMLRVFISGGGCSGFQYGFTFDEKIQDGDTEVKRNGVTLLVDPMSFQYLTGSEIDFTEGLEGSQFVIRNPNATTTCGCGSSFSV